MKFIERFIEKILEIIASTAENMLTFVGKLLKVKTGIFFIDYILIIISSFVYWFFSNFLEILSSIIQAPTWEKILMASILFVPFPFILDTYIIISRKVWPKVSPSIKKSTMVCCAVSIIYYYSK